MRAFRTRFARQWSGAPVKRETPGPLVHDAAKYTSVSYDWHLVSNYPGFRNFIIIIFSFDPDAVHAPTVIYSSSPRRVSRDFDVSRGGGATVSAGTVVLQRRAAAVVDGRGLQRKFDRKWETRRHLNRSGALT